MRTHLLLLSTSGWLPYFPHFGSLHMHAHENITTTVAAAAHRIIKEII